MRDETKVRLVQAGFGAVILTLLMQPIIILGYANFIWLLFLPLLLFFALGGNFKKIPSMIVGYGCGILWALSNNLIVGLFSSFLPFEIANIVSTILLIFTILTIHENLLINTIFSNVPTLFLGLATTFFSFSTTITPLHLIGFFLYGMFLTCALVGGGFLVCSLVFGKQRVLNVFNGKEEKEKIKS